MILHRMSVSNGLLGALGIQGTWSFISWEQEEKIREQWNLLKQGILKGEKVKLSKDEGNMLPPTPSGGSH